jgi:hypothetical protein
LNCHSNRRMSSRVTPFITAALVLSIWQCVGMVCYADQVTWNIDNLASIGGHATTVIGSPIIVSSPFGAALRFDGNDGLIVNASPIAGATSFTMEMLLRPDANDGPVLDQPRILHVQTSAPNDHRAILEGRIDGDQWYLDGFLRAPNASNPSTIGSLALIDANKLHPVNQWYSYAMVYDGSELQIYLNGELELSGPIALLPLAMGQTSIGMRYNQVNFFSGDISRLRFTSSALPADQLLSARLPGDFNGDYYTVGGGIDDADLAIWQAGYGLDALGDADGDGDTDGRDFVIWQRNFSPGSNLTSSISVPEPACIVLMAMTLLFWNRACRNA